MVASSGTGGWPPAPVGGDLFPFIVPRSRREREGAKRHVPSTRLRRFIAALAAVTGGVLPWAAVPAASAATIPVPGPCAAYRPATPGGPAQMITAGGMPGWQITLIALAAALAAAVTAVRLPSAAVAVTVSVSSAE